MAQPGRRVSAGSFASNAARERRLSWHSTCRPPCSTILQPESECGKAIDVSNVEYDLGDVPQVDLMRRLLVGLFLDSLDVPIMRKWYFPSQRKAMLVVLGDQDGADFEQMKVVLGMVKELGTPYTLYVTPADQPMTKEQFKVLADGGMEFALHPDFVSPGRKFTEEEFAAQLKKADADVGCPMTGERTHSCRWESFRDVPSWAERAGLQYDADSRGQVVGVETAERRLLGGNGAAVPLYRPRLPAAGLSGNPHCRDRQPRLLEAP